MDSGGGLVRERVVFSGRVQGVGFRATCVGVAREGGVTGWVRNLADGRVEAEVQGSETAIGALLAGVAERTFGRVDGVERSPLGVVVDETGFVIR